MLIVPLQDEDGCGEPLGQALPQLRRRRGVIRSSRVGRPNRNTPWWPGNYRIGTWAYVLHRLTGLALVAYLFIHMWVISFAAVRWGGFSFEQVMALLRTPPFLVFDLGLLGILLFHGLNGLRILLFDTGIGIRVQREIFWAVAAITVLGEAAAIAVWLPHVLGRG